MKVEDTLAAVKTLLNELEDLRKQLGEYVKGERSSDNRLSEIEEEREGIICFYSSFIYC
jgi:hypothetical protein